MNTMDKFRMQDKTCVIAGGSGLLGQEFSKTLIEYGARVVLADLNESKGNQFAEKYPSQASFVRTDVTNKESVESLVLSTLKSFKKIDVLVNCAALDPKIGMDNPALTSFEEYPLENWQNTINVNLTGAFLLCQAVGKSMLETGGGVMVNVASELGLIAPDQRIYEKGRYKPIDYPITKAALLHMTRYLAAYWQGKNIRVNSLSPASVQDSQSDKLAQNISYRTILGRLSKKDEFNGAIIFLTSAASSYMTGANLIVDGGRSAW